MLQTPARALLPPLALVLLALGAGCSDGSSDASSDAGGSTSAEVAPNAPAVDGAVADRAEPARAGRPDPLVDERAIIYRGDVALRSPDVGRSQLEVQKVVDRYGGTVTEERTTTDDDGEPAYTRMVLRIPSEDFPDAMAALKDVSELESARSGEDDVTTKVIDVRSRLEVQRRSVARISTLLDRAQSIRDIVAIESQLSRRQADLESLERRAAYLENQTSLSTITVSIDRIVPRSGPDEDHAGFLAGLSAGWHALTAFAVGLATALGAVLPWLVVLAAVGPLVWLGVRVVRRRRPPAGQTG